MEYLAEYKLRGDVQWRLLGERERIALLDIAKSDPSVTDIRIVPLALAVAAPALRGMVADMRDTLCQLSVCYKGSLHTDDQDMIANTDRLAVSLLLKLQPAYRAMVDAALAATEPKP